MARSILATAFLAVHRLGVHRSSRARRLSLDPDTGKLWVFDYREKSMSHPRFTGDEIARRGEQWYERSIRSRVEAEANIGKILSIDVETGDYELGDDPVVTSRKLQARHSGAAIWTKRVGYDAVYSVGGTRTTC
jgi:hypothetical protein